MSNFFKKTWVAVTFLVVSMTAAIIIGRVLKPASDTIAAVPSANVTVNTDTGSNINVNPDVNVVVDTGIGSNASDNSAASSDTGNSSGSVGLFGWVFGLIGRIFSKVGGIISWAFSLSLIFGIVVIVIVVKIFKAVLGGAMGLCSGSSGSSGRSYKYRPRNYGARYNRSVPRGPSAGTGARPGNAGPRPNSNPYSKTGSTGRSSNSYNASGISPEHVEALKKK